MKLPFPLQRQLSCSGYFAMQRFKVLKLILRWRMGKRGGSKQVAIPRQMLYISSFWLPGLKCLGLFFSSLKYSPLWSTLVQ